ncbi:MAG: hypothetical protein LBK71_11165 [Verrucomicrobiales bacterium]|nr:hypothetical protein [Verrucomicrobiales bacterium]
MVGSRYTAGGGVGQWNFWCRQFSAWATKPARWLGAGTVSDPFAPVAGWINANLSAGVTVYVVPNHHVYSLMFHAPRAQYAWQLEPARRREPQFAALPAVHFKGTVAPEYLIAFGPHLAQLRRDIEQHLGAGASYQLVARIDTYWQPLYRPELF